MTTLTDVDVAEILMDLDRRDLLEAGTPVQIYEAAERALTMKERRMNLSPRRSVVDDEAVADAEAINEATDMLRSRGISRERLEEVAEAMRSIAEPMHVTNLGA